MQNVQAALGPLTMSWDNNELIEPRGTGASASPGDAVYNGETTERDFLSAL